jgi:hypothetical protein
MVGYFLNHLMMGYCLGHLIKGYCLSYLKVFHYFNPIAHQHSYPFILPKVWSNQDHQGLYFMVSHHQIIDS